MSAEAEASSKPRAETSTPPGSPGDASDEHERGAGERPAEVSEAAADGEMGLGSLFLCAIYSGP